MALTALFDVRPDERRGATFAFLALLGVTAAHTLIETARDALFLARIPATHLPGLYLAIAALGVVTTRSSAALASSKKRRGRAEETATPKRKLDPVVISMIGAAAITTGFWIAAASPSPYVLYALYVFSGMFAGWVAGQLWLRFGALFDVAQAKRLYGAIGTGAVLGAVLGSALARAALALIDVRHLLLAAALILVVTALGPAGLLPTPVHRPRSRALAEADDEAAEAGASLGAEIANVTRHPYLLRLLLLTLLAGCAGTAIDFLFKRHIAGAYAPAQLGSIFATVSLSTNIASLLAQAIGVGVLVRWLGIHRALYVMPVLLALGAGSAILGAGLFANAAGYAIFGLRGADGALRYSLHKTTTELLFVPIADSVRSRAKPIIDLVGQRGGQALISVVLLAVATLVTKEAVGLVVAAGIFALALAWTALAWSIRPRYLDVFRETLRRGRVELSSDVPELDMSALEALIAALSSRRDAEVLGALDLLAAQHRGRLIPSLVLFHPSKPIVLRTLELFVREGRRDFLDVADRLIDHADPEIRAAALRARAAVDPDPAFLRERLTSPHEEVRATALVALLAKGGELSSDEARVLFTSILEGDLPSRRALARALMESGASSDPLLDEIVRRLLADPDSETRKLAAMAMSTLGGAAYGPILIDFLADRVAGIAGIEALGAMGDSVVKLLDATLERDDVGPEVRWRVAAALARSPSPDALRVLMKHVTTTTDTALRSRLLRALRTKQSGGAVITIPEAHLVSLATSTIAAVARALAFRLAHAKLLRSEDAKTALLPGAELVQRLLRDKEIEGVDRLFLVLSLLYPLERFPRIQRGLESADAKARASARELLENVIEPPLRDLVLALTDDVTDDVRLARLAKVKGDVEREETTYTSLLRAMVRHGSELGALALFHAGELGIADAMQADAEDLATDASTAALVRDLSAKTLASGGPTAPSSSTIEVGST